MTDVINVPATVRSNPLNAAEARMSKTVAMITGSSAQLAKLLRQLQLHLDDIDQVICCLDDVGLRVSLQQKAISNRSSLVNAMAVLTDELRKLTPLHMRLISRARNRLIDADNLERCSPSFTTEGFA